MNNFLLILLVALVIGEVSGGLQVGVPAQSQQPTTPIQAQGETDGNIVFAAVVAIILVAGVIAMQQYAR